MLLLGTALCLGTALTCLALAVLGVGDRTAQLTHAVMGGAMAGMFSPWGNPVPAWAGVVGFTVVGAWFAAAVLRGPRDGAAAHLAISAAAMVLMYLVHGSGGGGHAGHAMPGMPDAGPGELLLTPLALLLAGYFAWHAWRCVDRARSDAPASAAPASDAPASDAPGCGHAASGSPVDTPSAVRAAPVTHGVMSALMAAMFLGMV